jgi:antirestriction protein ArdC
LPCNIVSKQRYSGVNPLLLQVSAMKKGFRSRWWGTFNQWKAVGGRVMKRPDGVEAGHWGTKVIFFKPIVTVAKNDVGEEEERTWPILREYVLFCADQVEGAPQFQVQEPSDERTEPDFQPAEKVIAATGADIRHGGDVACYHLPPEDYISMPYKMQFEQQGGLAGYYDTTFHELGHWSEPRMGWERTSYALSELRAEMAGAFLSAEIGVPSNGPNQKNHAAYLDHWIGAMKEDYRVIFRVASAASAAADFILSFSKGGSEPEKQEEPEPATA